jgi:hypothetical protein
MMLASALTVGALTLGALTLGAGVASAQGLPPGYQPPAYGSAWASDKLAAEKAHDAAIARLTQQQTTQDATNAPANRAHGG